MRERDGGTTGGTADSDGGLFVLTCKQATLRGRRGIKVRQVGQLIVMGDSPCLPVNWPHLEEGEESRYDMWDSC